MLFFFESFFQPQNHAERSSGSQDFRTRRGDSPGDRTNRSQESSSQASNHHPLNELFSPGSFVSTLFGSGMQEFFGSTMQGMAPDFFQPHAPPETHRAPPCSRLVFSQLPRVAISPSDLVIDNNRICSVCLEPHSLGEVVVRLPCAHLYHSDCIVPWLEASNACPVCRYELPTDDQVYERNRLERMRSRKPRFYAHELQRLSVAQLRSLGGKPVGCCDKQTWTQHLQEQNLIEVIPTPPPAVLHWNDLIEMTTSQLKACMEENGVFYDPKLVVEKSDLLAIFCNSGRLQLVKDDDEKRDVDWEVNGAFDSESADEGERDFTESGPVKCATVGADPSVLYGIIRKTERGRMVMVETVENSDEEFESDEARNRRETHSNIIETNNLESLRSAASVRKRRRRSRHMSESAPRPNRTSDLEQALSSWSLAQLRGYAHQLSVDTTHCLERREIVLQLVGATRSAFEGMQAWGPCELRAAAAALTVNVVDFDSPADLLEEIQRLFIESPRNAFVMSGMSLLGGKTVRELRALANSWRLDLSDCLEKSEIMNRLLLHHQVRSLAEF